MAESKVTHLRSLKFTVSVHFWYGLLACCARTAGSHWSCINPLNCIQNFIMHYHRITWPSTKDIHKENNHIKNSTLMKFLHFSWSGGYFSIQDLLVKWLWMLVVYWSVLDWKVSPVFCPFHLTNTTATMVLSHFLQICSHAPEQKVPLSRFTDSVGSAQDALSQP